MKEVFEIHPNKLIKARKINDISLNELAKKTGLNMSKLLACERFKKEFTVSAKELKALSNALYVQTDYFTSNDSYTDYYLLRPILFSLVINCNQIEYCEDNLLEDQEIITLNKFCLSFSQEMDIYKHTFLKKLIRVMLKIKKTGEVDESYIKSISEIVNEYIKEKNKLKSSQNA